MICNKECGICNNKYYLYWTKEQLMGVWNLIRWGEIFVMVGGTFFLWFAFGGWWAFLFYLALGIHDWSHFGPLDTPHHNETKLPCSAGIKDCCGNGYDHEFNVKYYESLKWYQKYL